MDAPPAFLLDSRRMSPAQPVRPGMFDNRWKVFPQDFPAGHFLQSHRIGRILLIQRHSGQPQEDLAHVLRRWQDAGLAIQQKDVTNALPPRDITVGRPAWYRAMWYRVLAMLGLQRGRPGGFGGIIPEPSKG
jgi:hypothetical protein